jgi:hypothetical protein
VVLSTTLPASRPPSKRLATRLVGREEHVEADGYPVRAVRWSHAAPLVHGETVRPVHLLGDPLSAAGQRERARMTGKDVRRRR